MVTVIVSKFTSFVREGLLFGPLIAFSVLENIIACSTTLGKQTNEN